MQQTVETDGTTPVQLNLADLNLRFWGQEAWLYGYVLQTGCPRLSVGSYFCEVYFFKTAGMLLSGSLDFLGGLGVSLTLVVPVFSQMHLERAKETLLLVLEKRLPYLDEITVNDFGMLLFLEKRKEEGAFSGRIVAGRQFFKNLRDPAYQEYTSGEVSVFFPEPLKGRVQAAECDIVSCRLDMSEFPEDVEIYVHYPYTYVSCGQMCEFACASDEENLYRQTTMRCRTTCMQGYLRTGDGCRELTHTGKGVYFEAPFLQQINKTPARWLYWAMQEVLGG